MFQYIIYGVLKVYYCFKAHDFFTSAETKAKNAQVMTVPFPYVFWIVSGTPLLAAIACQIRLDILGPLSLTVPMIQLIYVLIMQTFILIFYPP